jgi:hypothetical protein
MAKIALPPDIASMFAACEQTYEQAIREGYGGYPNVTTAVSELRPSWNALHIASRDLIMAKGFFTVEFASMRFERACQATREACIKLKTAIAQAAAEHDLHNRCSVLARPDQHGARRAKAS